MTYFNEHFNPEKDLECIYHLVSTIPLESKGNLAKPVKDVSIDTRTGYNKAPTSQDIDEKLFILSQLGIHSINNKSTYKDMFEWLYRSAKTVTQLDNICKSLIFSV